MDYQDLRNYIFQFVRQYAPYKEYEFYQILVNFLEEIYYQDTYTEIPNEFKILFEEHTLNTYLYDIVLRSLGFPREIVESVPSTHKQIMLNSFSDYNNRKGTYKIIKEATASFGDPINVYELYADFRYLSGQWDWWFIPREVYQNVEREPEPKFYDTIYHGTPTYYVSKQQMHNWFVDERIALPIKSNLLLLSMTTQTNSDEMSILTMMTALHYFKDEDITISMRNGVYNITLIGLYQLWHYLLAYYRGTVSSSIVQGELVYFDISGATFPYTIEENLPNSINVLLEEYDELIFADEIRAFYKKYFKDVFSKVAPSTVGNLTTIRKSLLYTVDINLVAYIENQLETSTDVETEIVSVMQELRGSLTLHINNSDQESMVEYKNYILNAFELSIIIPEKTTTYKLIDFFKPFHTQIVSEQQQIISNKSKFNNTGILDHYRMFIIRDFPPTVCVVSDDHYFCERIEGNFEFSITDQIRLMDSTSLVQVTVGDKIFVREQDQVGYSGTPDNLYPLDHLTTITEIAQTGIDQWIIKIESAYTGTTGQFNAIYKRYHLLES